MRWEALFDDLEAILVAHEARELESLVAEQVRAEQARVELSRRLLAHAGHRLTLWLATGEVEGVVVDVAPSWLMLHDGPTQVLVPYTAISAVQGLGREVAVEPGVVLRALSLGHALRALARDRAGVAVHLPGRIAHGTIDRVGADHFDLALHEPGQWRRRESVRGVATVAFGAVEFLRSVTR